MTVNFYTTSSDTRMLTKDLGTAYVVKNCEPTHDCSVLTPKLILRYTSDLMSKNYAHIADFGNRYYYITNIDVVPGGKMIIDLSIDVLQTYSASILSCTGTVLRNEMPNGFNAPTKISDSKFPIDANIKNCESITLIPADTIFNVSTEQSYRLGVLNCGDLAPYVPT